LLASNSFGSTPGGEASFETGADKPLIESQSSSEVTTATATLSATINPRGGATTCVLQYGLTGSYGSEKPCPGGLGEGTAAVPVSVELSGLSPNSVYHYQFVATNSVGSAEGKTLEDAMFRTLVPLPVVTNKPPLAITRTTASLSAEIDTGNDATTYSVKYGETLAYENGSTPPALLNAALGPSLIAPVELSKLKPGKTYHYRILAENEAGPVEGADATFTTSPPTPPTPPFIEARAVFQTSVKITAKVNPDGLQTTYELQFGTDTKYTATPIHGTVGDGNAPVSFTVEGSKLFPGTTYHYRILATNEDGTVSTEDQTLTTEPLRPPVIGPVSAQASSQTTGTITAQINPNALQTSYLLELWSNTTYSIPNLGQAGSGSTPVLLTLRLANLSPATTYHYVLAATNEDGTTYSPEQTLTTPEPPVALVQQPSAPPLPRVNPTNTPETKTTTLPKKHPNKHTKRKRKTKHKKTKTKHTQKHPPKTKHKKK
jgi:hypothetical protein